jgi:hypothetical protein
VKLYVVSLPTLGAVPVIAPVLEFNDIPDGNAPEYTEYVILDPASESVAETLKLTEPFL